MTDDTEVWREADRIFALLLDEPRDARETLLAALAPEDAVARRVRQLLAAHDATAAGVLDRPLPSNPGGARDALGGRRFGRWQLEREIGRGGMSVVYRAHAADAPEHTAAVKLLTLGALAAHGAARFEQEQAVLARLRHPHIATLFEAGRADDGTPWLAMALVDGVTIDVWCARQRLGVRAIVMLMLDVCAAVAHAHRNLVIHRDIKPSNVLVDENGHVRLLDFGIARLVDDAGDGTLTQHRLLTPRYAAPEQFTGGSPSTAIDVYGVASLSYRLLTGHAPRADGDTDDASIRVPSQRADDPHFARALRGDLDAVLMKALSFDPARRQDSVTALAQDFTAWLEQRPVSARQPGWAYRLRRFAWRHRVPVFATTAVVLALIGGLATTWWQANRAERAAALARVEATNAQANAARATAIKDFVLSLFETTDVEREGGGAADSRSMLRIGVARLLKRADIGIDERVEILTTIAEAQRTMGWYDDATETFKEADAIAADVGVTPLRRAALLHQHANYERVREHFDAALAYVERSSAEIAGDRTLAADHLRVQQHTLRGNALSSTNRYRESLAAYDAAAALMGRLPDVVLDDRISVLLGRGAAAHGSGDYALAREHWQAALALQKAAGIDAGMALTLSHLANASSMIGFLDDAIEYDRQALEIARRSFPAGHARIAESLYAYGDMLRQASRFDEALVALDEGHAISVALDNRRSIVVLELARVRVLNALGRFEEAAARAAAARPALELSEGAGSLASVQLMVQQLAALTSLDRPGELAQTIDAASRLIATLGPEVQWHPVAQFLRWRIAQTLHERGDDAGALRGLDAADAVPATATRHVTSEIVRPALRLAIAARVAGADPGALRTAARSVLTSVDEAKGASGEAIAVALLAVAAAHDTAGDRDAARAALAKLDALHRERPLPAIYARALQKAMARTR
jgi:tetratricopeptide (TPR) repeat protein